MLVLECKPNEEFLLRDAETGREIKIIVFRRTRNGLTALGITAPRVIEVRRIIAKECTNGIKNK